MSRNYSLSKITESKTIDLDTMVHQLFEKQAEKKPDKVAVVCGGEKITYSTLNEQANRLAWYLRYHYKIKPDDLVALCLDRSAYIPVGILAILKAGGAYVPIDPGTPESRVKYILEDTATRVILTDSKNAVSLRNIVADHPIGMVEIDSKEWQDQSAVYPAGNPDIDMHSFHLIYVIYTSGTTGRPKGVMIAHRSLTDYFWGLLDKTNIRKCQRFGLVTTINADLGNTVLFASLLTGGSLYIYSADEITDAKRMHSISIDCLKIVPAHWNALQYDGKILLPKKCLIFGGEQLTKDIVGLIAANHAPCKVFNHYGPTETTIGKLIKEINIDAATYEISLGYPIGRTKVYIINEQNKPASPGEAGEICISGEGLARGYLNLPAITAEKFVENPFKTGERIYRTGDLGRFLPDGSIAFIGRKDDQIKIRGFRVELKEIESVLCTYNGIKQAVVLAKEHAGSGRKYIVGYYHSDESLQTDKVMQYLSASLPDYMVPVALLPVKKIPLLGNGKIDRKSLPDIDISDSPGLQEPQNEMMKKLCILYAELLTPGFNSIGIHDDFFLLGGDSIISIQLVSRIRQQLGVRISVKDIFKYRTIAGLYEKVIAGARVINENLRSEQGMLNGAVGLLPCQTWMFININNGTYTADKYCDQSFMINVPKLDVSVLEMSLSLLTQYHDALRLYYTKEKTAAGIYYKQYYRKVLPALKLHCANVAELPQQGDIIQHFNRWKDNVDLFAGPVFQVGYLDGCSDGRARIYFALHHLIADAVSWRIIKDDLQKIYNHLAQQKADSGHVNFNFNAILGEKGTSYRQWVAAIADYPNSFNGYNSPQQEERSYWHSVTSGITEGNNYLRHYMVTEVSRVEINLNKIQTARLVKDAGKIYHTRMNDLLLTAFALSLPAITGTMKNVVLLEGHGRESMFSELDVSHTVGRFTTMYPILLHIHDFDIGNSIVAIKESLRKVPNNGIGYGALIGYASQELPGISFNYLGQFDMATGYNEKQEWFISGEGSSLPESPHGDILNLNAWISDGILKFNIKSRLNKELLENFKDKFYQQITDLIIFLSKQSRSYLTPSDIDNIISIDYLNKIQLTKEVDAIYLANSLQEGFIFHWLNQGNIDDAYRMQVVLDYHEWIDVKNLKLAWIYAQKKYSVLRMRFEWEEELVQIIDKEIIPDWIFMDISSLSIADKEVRIKEILLTDRKQVYDLSAGKLFRTYLIKLSDNYYRFVLSYHHAIMDGWSSSILLNYIHQTYMNLMKGYPVTDTPDNSYTSAQQYLQKNRNINLPYWDNYLMQLESKEDFSNLLSPDRKRVILSECKRVVQAADLTIKIEGNTYKLLKEFCAKHGFTLNAVLQFCWHKQLHLYGVSENTIVGMTVSGRNLEIDGIEKSVGLFINTLPIILEHNDGYIIDNISTLQDHINEANIRSNVSLRKLQKEGRRLFNSLFAFENYPVSDIGRTSETHAVSLIKTIEKLDYPLAVVAIEQDDTVTITIRYDNELFDDNIIGQLGEGIGIVLDQIFDNENRKSNELCCLSKKMYDQVVYAWNDTDCDYPPEMTAHEFFENRVKQTPDKTAVIFEEKQLTYREVNEMANRLGWYLRNQYEIVPDNLIGLFLDRSEYIPVSILGVLKSGGAYVPMDVSYPEERIRHIISDTGTKVVLTNKVHATTLSGIIGDLPVAIVCIDSESFFEKTATYSASNPPIINKTWDLAYVIYTSGTTGMPKGVMVQHHGLINAVVATGINRKIQRSSNVLSTANYVFDSSVLEIFCSIFSGATLFLINNKLNFDLTYILQFIQDKKITNIFFTTKLFESIFADSGAVDKLKDIISITFAGELLNKEMENIWPFAVINEYGPTEGTICSTCISYKEKIVGAIIGRPISNVKVYVLNNNMMPLPPGAPGELYIGGVGIARGYLNQPALTDTRFVVNPFQTNKEKENGRNDRLYKTGDIVRYLPDGNIEYINRNDFQVKIRGYRIELGEIEHQMLAFPAVIQAVVVAKTHPNGAKYLVGYYVSEKRLIESDMLAFLNNLLPDYMIPVSLVYLEKLPLTINGKLNWHMLPDPDFTNNDHYTAPGNQTELTLCNLFSAILGLDPERIGIHDDFFRLGGDSILAIKLAAGISNTFGRKVSVTDIFTNKSIHKLFTLLVAEKDTHTLIVKLNSNNGTNNMFMIHPGGAGCEVYIPLAEKLTPHCRCFGINSYNLHYPDKIKNITQLAEYYLAQINSIEKQHPSPHTCTLLGWSLGGRIALEIACLLESKGVKNITIYLLDTVLINENNLLLSLMEEELKHKNYPEDSPAAIEYKLMEQPVAKKLRFSKIVLFKAKVETEDEIGPFGKYVLSLDCNNIEKGIENIENLKVVNMTHDSHKSIIFNTDELLHAIIKKDTISNTMSTKKWWI